MHNNANRYVARFMEDAVLKVEKIEDSKKDMKCMIFDKYPINLEQKVEKDEKKEGAKGKVIEKIMKWEPEKWEIPNCVAIFVCMNVYFLFIMSSPLTHDLKFLPFN